MSCTPLCHQFSFSLLDLMLSFLPSPSYTYCVQGYSWILRLWRCDLNLVECVQCWFHHCSLWTQIGTIARMVHGLLSPHESAFVYVISGPFRATARRRLQSGSNMPSPLRFSDLSLGIGKERPVDSSQLHWLRVLSLSVLINWNLKYGHSDLSSLFHFSQSSEVGLLFVPGWHRSVGCVCCQLQAPHFSSLFTPFLPFVVALSALKHWWNYFKLHSYLRRLPPTSTSAHSTLKSPICLPALQFKLASTIGRDVLQHCLPQEHLILRCRRGSWITGSEVSSCALIQTRVSGYGAFVILITILFILACQLCWQRPK